MMDLVRALWPVGLGSAEWRFGAMGLLSSAMAQPLLGSVIVVVVATHGERRRLQGFMCGLNALAAMLLVLALPLFVLDSMELRSVVPETNVGAFDMAALGAVLLHGLTVLVLAALSWAGYKSWRRLSEQAKARSSASPPLVVPER